MTLVVGATGVLGFEVCRRLRSKDVQVRALVRPGSPRERELVDIGVEIAYGDLKDRPSLDAACRDMERVISTATAMTRKGDSLKTVDCDGHLDLVRAAQLARVRHIVYTSVSPEANPRAVLVRYKRRVERAVRESRMVWTVLQPAAFMETWFGPAAGWNLDEGKIRMVGPGTATFNPVSLADVAEFAAMTAVQPETERRVIPIGGPDVVTPMAAVRVFEEVLGRKLEVSHVPAAVIGAVGTILRPFNPAFSSLLALAAGASHGEVINMSLVLSEFPVELTTLREFAERANA
jgi:uncharacterized protein YbjT (DUF2867 family)